MLTRNPKANGSGDEKGRYDQYSPETRPYWPVFDSLIDLDLGGERTIATNFVSHSSRISERSICSRTVVVLELQHRSRCPCSRNRLNQSKYINDVHDRKEFEYATVRPIQKIKETHSQAINDIQSYRRKEFMTISQLYQKKESPSYFVRDCVARSSPEIHFYFISHTSCPIGRLCVSHLPPSAVTLFEFLCFSFVLNIGQ
jgi:hypothetical protein